MKNNYENPILSKIFKMGDLRPDKISIQDDQKHLTYSQLRDQIKKAATFFKSNGVVPGDRLLILIENTVDHMVALLGILEAGATAVSVNPHLPTSDLLQLITQSDPVAILSIKGNAEKLLPQSIPGLPVWEIQENLAPNPLFPTPPCLKKLPDRDCEVAVILYTSGTSGNYKGTNLTYQNVLTAVETANSLLSFDANIYCVLPLYHVAVILIISILMFGGLLRFFKLENIFQMFQTGEPFKAGTVPRILEVLLAKIQSDPALQNFFKKLPKGFIELLCAGAPLSPKVEQAYLDLGIPVYCAYGLTETSGICVMTPKNKKVVVGSVGLCLPDMEVRIDGANDKGEGEICIRGPQIMKGYFRNPKATAETIRDGWLYSGDLGYIDPDGYLFVTGRLKDIIDLPTGEKAMPDNVEFHYSGIKGIKDLAIVGIPAKGQGWDEIHAAVIPENREATLQEIEKLIYERGKSLPFHLQIQKVHLVHTIPKTALQKVRRNALKELLKNETETKNVQMPVTDDPLYLWLRTWLAKALGIKPSEIDENRMFTSYGIDSLTIWQLSESLNEEFDLNVSPLAIIDYQSIAKLAEYCKANQHKGEVSKVPPISLADRSKELPLSFAEQMHWERAQYPWQNYLIGSDLTGPIDADILQKSVEALLERHEILRTTYHKKGARLVRQIHPKCEGAFHFFDFSSYPEEKQKKELDQLTRSFKEKPIDMGSLPLAHFILVKLSSTQHVLLSWMSRILADGSSLILLFDDLASLYKDRMERNPTSSLKPQTYQYADYAQWQRSLYEQGVFQKEEQFWKELFGKMELVPLPGKKKSLSKEEQFLKANLQAEKIPIFIPEPICKQLTSIALQRNTFFQTLLATALQVALYKATKNRNITIRDLTANRKKLYLERMIGYLITGLGIIGDFSVDRKFEDHLADHQRQIHLAMMNTDIFFEALIDKWGSLIKGAPPLSLNVSFNFLPPKTPGNIGNGNLSLKDLHLEDYLYPPGLELDLVLTYTPDGSVMGGMSYKKALFDHASITQIAQDYLHVLQKVAENPSILVSEIFKG